MIRAVRFLILSAFVFPMVVTPVVAHEDNEGDTNNAQHRLEDLRVKRDEAKQRLQDRREEIQQKRDETGDKVEERLEIAKQKIAERIKKVFAVIVRRLNAALVRLDRIAERIATRIDKLNERGVNTTAAEEALASAEVLGAGAAQAVGDASAAIEAIDTTDLSVREAMHAAKDAIGAVKDALKAYHKGLVAAIRELKASAALREATEGAESED